MFRARTLPAPPRYSMPPPRTARCKKIIGHNYAIPVVVADVFRPGVPVHGGRMTREAGTVRLSDGRI